MTQEPSLSRTLTNGVRTALGIAGIIAIIIGILILVAPLKTASVITAFIAIYAVVAGVIYAALGIFAKSASTWGRIGNVLLGVLFVVAGIVAFTDLGNVTTVLAIFTAIFIGVSWIFEGVLAFASLRGASNKVWGVVFAVLSIIAGILVITAPFAFAALLWLILGVALVVLGILQIVRAFSYRGPANGATIRVDETRI
ncbi:HdeD family acid-resistance protein [Mycetocola saprophilus]|uniref:HdeD family acid-resistance protein n=1 Tax=Mycetocola saprophilus TaxID=76636 RepID=UPI003BEFF8F0